MLPPPNTEAQLADLVLWLELRFAMLLSPAETEILNLDVPGLTVNSQRARALLGDAIAALSAADTERRWREVDARLHGCAEMAAHHPRGRSLGSICDAFGLDPVDRQILWLAAAPDLAGNLAQTIGFLNDDLSLRRPTPALLARAIPEAGPAWKLAERLSGNDLMARFRLVEPLPADPLTPDSLVPLRIPPDLLAALCGTSLGSTGAMTIYETGGNTEEFDLQLTLVQWAAGRAEGQRPLVYFHAPPSDAPWLASQLSSVGNRVVVGDLAALAALDTAAVLAGLLEFGRAARIADAILVVGGIDDCGDAARASLIRCVIGDLVPHLPLVVVQAKHTPITAFQGAAGGITEIARSRPTREERVLIWSYAAAASGLDLSEPSARDLAATFAFDRDQAEATVALALGSGAIGPPRANAASLRDAARIVSRASAPPSVTRIETRQGWDDIVLPKAVKSDLMSIVAQIRHGATVWDEWGFASRIPYGQATIALLAGPSGTGKTMAAQIIAGELGAALFQVDLAKTVSKYIGETEKALDRIFQAAEAASAVLLFDEADALFGKRSEIHDAHDRYANIEVNFLLQRIEEHLAPVLLTTNRKANIDSAFLRRLSKVVDFPMPDEEQRAEIWQRMLPPEARVDGDVDLAAFRHLPLSGGAIANTVLAAAFMGAEDGGMIRMRHLVAAARGELAKSGMPSAGRSLTHLIDGARNAGAEA